MTVALLLLIFFSSVILTVYFRRYAVSRNVLAIPNQRSSHATVTPNGGGGAIVIAFIVGLIGLQFVTPIDLNLLFAIVGAGVFVAIIGFWDDHKALSAKLRLLVHFASAFWLIYWLDTESLHEIFDLSQVFNWLLILLVSVLLVWLLNLYNFMDGIDGIASSEAIFVSAVLGCFSFIEGQQGLALMAFALCMATSGFLVFNWPPARIFMGDVGSGFLGVTLGGLSLALMLMTQLVWPCLVLFGVFLVDATVTLISRFLRGERWYDAHCNHAYQHAARKWGHFRVTMVVNIINLCWLLPCAYAAYVFPDIALIILIVAFIPIIMIVLMIGAGVRKHGM